jgi:hypothetical protein
MKNNTESKNEATPKAPKAKAKPKSEPAATPVMTAKRAKEPADRLPSTIDELKAGKTGLATYLFLSGKAKGEIEGELMAAFKLPDNQATKITRRVLGRARFFQRALSLVTAK